MNENIVLVRTTFATADAAGGMARAVLAARLAACVQQHAVQSMYHWRDRIETADEIAWTGKTRAGLAARLTEFIKEHHPYETPEILTLPVLDADPAFRDWIYAETDAAKME